MDSKLIGARIKHLREKKGLSQHQLAKDVGFASATQMSYLENGHRAIKAEDLFKIAMALGEPIENFFQSDRPQKSAPEVQLRSVHKKMLSPSAQDKITHFIEEIRKRQNVT